MKTLLHDSKIKIDSGKGFFHHGYVFSNDIYLAHEGRLNIADRNHDDDGKIFLMQEGTCLNGKAKDRAEYIELGKDEVVLFGNKKMQVRFLGDYSDMAILKDTN